MSAEKKHFFEVEPEAESLAPLRKKLRPLLEAGGFGAKAVHDTLLCIDEVLANVIRHGYGGENRQPEKGKIRVTVSDLKDRAEVLIEDEGPCFDPRKVPSPELPSRRPGGLGVYLVRSLMDEVGYEPLQPRGNRLRLVKYK